jgi:hypothetical protein
MHMHMQDICLPASGQPLPEFYRAFYTRLVSGLMYNLCTPLLTPPQTPHRGQLTRNYDKRSVP